MSSDSPSAGRRSTEKDQPLPDNLCTCREGSVGDKEEFDHADFLCHCVTWKLKHVKLSCQVEHLNSWCYNNIIHAMYHYCHSCLYSLASFCPLLVPVSPNMGCHFRPCRSFLALHTVILNAAFHLPQKSEVGAGNDVTPDLDSTAA